MGREQEIIKEREKKIGELRKLGVNPYPHKFDKKDSAGDLQEKYAKLGKEKFGKAAKVAGFAPMRWPNKLPALEPT